MGNEPSLTRNLTTDFPSWAEHNDGALTGLFSPYFRNGQIEPDGMSTLFYPMNKGMHSRMKCRDALPHANNALDHFDLVGATSCIPQLLDALALRMHLPPDTAMQRTLRRSSIKHGKLEPMQKVPMTTYPNQVAYKSSRFWTWETLNA